MVQVTSSLAPNSWITVVFSSIDIVLVLSPSLPEGPVMLGIISSISVTVTFTESVSDWFCAPSLAIIVNSYSLSWLISRAASKSGEALKVKTPVDLSRSKAEISAPESKNHVTFSFASKENTEVSRFSSTSISILGAPSMMGASKSVCSSTSVTLTVTVW